jgi:hypothetical protein
MNGSLQHSETLRLEVFAYCCIAYLFIEIIAFSEFNLPRWQWASWALVLGILHVRYFKDVRKLLVRMVGVAPRLFDLLCIWLMRQRTERRVTHIAS